MAPPGGRYRMRSTPKTGPRCKPSAAAWKARPTSRRTLIGRERSPMQAGYAPVSADGQATTTNQDLSSSCTDYEPSRQCSAAGNSEQICESSRVKPGDDRKCASQSAIV